MKQLYKTCFLLLVCIIFWGINGKVFSQWNPNYSIGTVTGKTDFSYNQTPDQLVEITPPLYTTGTALSYQWERSPTPDFAVITFIGTQSSYTFSGPLSETMYYRRKVTDASGNSIYSNIVRIQLVSVNWENINYIREHDLLKPGVTDWKTADQLPIGDKLQTTTYLDGLGRPLQKVSRETATPEQSGGLWGDMVQFSVYDTYGREPKQYLPYTTATELGKYKTSPLTEQPAYYTNRYNESSAFTNVTYYDDPTNRAKQVNDPGYSWDIARNTGNRFTYDQNDASENVRIFRIGYITGDIPFSPGAYPANTLFRTVHLNEENKKVIEYTNKAGQLILTKTRIDDVTAVAHGGYICVYNVYDDFGLLRYRLQPEAVKFLAANGWSFSATNGPQVLKELCFRYEYDDKGRNILKKAPGAKELRMLYDQRDRVVFMQDGNQANKPQWTANLYDELDRPTITSLYNTAKSIAVLQSDIDNSATTTPVSIVNPAAPVAFLEVNNRDITIPRYTAQNSIIFTEGFISAANDEFVGEINATATMSYTVNTTVYKNPISAADLNNPAISTIVKYRFYDDYSYAGAKSFDAGFDNTTAYSNSTAGVIPVAASKRTTSFPTGSMVRVLGTNTFLISTEYYDEKGRHIQTIEDNIKLGRDVTTLQYHWDGRLMSSHTNHTTDKSGYSNFGVLTKNIFDKIGRVTGVQKKFGTNAFKTIASYDFDDMGRLKTKRLDPGYTGSGKNELEALTYSYNIHNNITGINKDYALKTAGKYDKWGNFFGLYLGFDNRDNVFTDKQLDGHVTGLLWNTQGDDAQRKYDYTYDNAGRLNSAIFKEYTPPSGGAGGGWDNSKMDFSVSGSSGKITYDHNGNLLSMLQKGVLPGNNTPVTVDNLTYTYTAYSNKLLTVTDNGTLGSANGSLGDFKDARGPYLDHDYEYDDNGNLVIDQNKNPNAPEFRDVNDISYNFLDKPEVLVATKGTINIVYDADGNKLQKTYTPKDGTPAVTTTYINGYIYKGDDLQYINFEEGRIRVIKPVSLNNGYDGLTIAGNITLPVSPSGAGGAAVYDYFIRDYQENVRMILTEETHNGTNQCTMETSRAANEEPVFGQSGSANEVAATRYPKPPGWASNSSNSVSRLSKFGNTVGPNSLLKVMAGDVVNAKTDYYYAGTVTNDNNSLLTDVVNTLVMAISGSTATGANVKGGVSGISTNLNGSVPLASVADPDQATTDNIPRAYLNILFFDERFNFVSENSDAIRVAQSGSGAAPLVLANIKAPKNGYAYVYVSNENDEPVYFDNLQVVHNRGRIIEENHYYAFGLKIAGISSNKLGNDNYEGHLQNKNLYNDKELIDDADFNWYDYGFRNYDAQIGRFPQLDPLTDDYPELTPFQYASNEPIANVDLDGLEALPAVTVTAFISKTASHTTRAIAVNAVKIAANIVNGQIANQTLNQGLSNNNIHAQIGKQTWDYYEQNRDVMSYGDYLTLREESKNYYKGLNLMAWWAKNDFIKLNRAVINGVLPDALIVQIVEAGIEDSQQGFTSIMREGANTGLFIGSVGLFPKVGVGPRTPLGYSKLSKIFKYKKGGEMSVIEHIQYRHNFFTSFSNVSRFRAGFGVGEIKKSVDLALKYGNRALQSDGSIQIRYNVGRIIGTGSDGVATSEIMVYAKDGWVKTAFPIH